MKSQNKVRMSMMAMGFAAAMLFAGTARAQQEVDPSYFDLNPGTPAVQTADLDAVQSAPAAAQQNDISEGNMSIALQQDATMEASIVRIAILDSAIAVILVGGVVSMVAYALWVTKRERSSYPSAPSELPYHPARS